MRIRRKTAVTFISGEDGPTSIWIAGGKGRRPGLRDRIRQKRFLRRRKRAEASITADPHTLDEVIAYMKERYGARELEPDEHSVQEQRKGCREALIQKHAPRLLGDLQTIDGPDHMDEEGMRLFWEKVQERSRRADAVPEEVFPMDYHVYEIRREDGSLRFEIELHWGILSGSFSGSRQEMRILSGVCRDIYRYYGVTEEDIRTRSERYMALVLELAER